jgi:hypothetical protein
MASPPQATRSRLIAPNNGQALRLLPVLAVEPPGIAVVSTAGPHPLRHNVCRLLAGAGNVDADRAKMACCPKHLTKAGATCFHVLEVTSVRLSRTVTCCMIHAGCQA